MNSCLAEEGCKMISLRISGMAKQFYLQGFTQESRDKTPSLSTATPSSPVLPSKLF